VKNLIVILLLAFAINPTNGQKISFEWTDSIFSPGAQRNIWFHFATDGPCTVGACYTDCDTTNASKKINGIVCYNKFTYDTIVDFLKKNPTVKIEIRFNSSKLGNDNYNLRRTERAAKHCLVIFEQLGADINRIKAIGKGESNPIIPDSELLKIKDKKLWLKENYKNNRTEIVIIG